MAWHSRRARSLWIKSGPYWSRLSSYERSTGMDCGLSSRERRNCSSGRVLGGARNSIALRQARCETAISRICDLITSTSVPSEDMVFGRGAKQCDEAIYRNTPLCLSRRPIWAAPSCPKTRRPSAVAPGGSTHSPCWWWTGPSPARQRACARRRWCASRAFATPRHPSHRRGQRSAPLTA